ncbi:MAG: type VII secretion protein EssC [Ruminococcus sp.]|nr:type VII secretion protein EssC [Ruminococcus sp.]
MIVNFVYNDNLSSIILPPKVSGQFSFSDPSGRNVVMIEGIENKWRIRAASQYSIKVREGTAADGTPLGADEVTPKRLFQVRNSLLPSDRIYLFTEEYTDDRIEYSVFSVPQSCVITVGNGRSPRSVVYDNEYVSSEHATLQYSSGKWHILDTMSKNGTFVNGIRTTEAELKFGDAVFIMGMKMILGKACISINNPDKRVKLSSAVFKPIALPELSKDEIDDSREESFFDRSPRFKRDITPVEMPIDSPPKENNQDELPIILTVGPAMTMAMASMTTGAFAVTNAMATGNVKMAIPTVVMSGSMCLGTLLWPTLTRKYTRKQRDAKEKLRRAKYNEYLEMKRLDIKAACEEQAQILRENVTTTEECERRIMQVQRNLWERSIGQNDFLTFRIGTGDLPMFGKLQYNGRRFALFDDVLEDRMLELCEEPKILRDVPIAVSLLDESIGVTGNRSELIPFVKGVIIQLASLYSYDEVKLVMLYDKEDEEEFGFTKWLPHVWDREKTFRFIASTAEEAKSVSAYLERVFSNREEMNDSDLEDEQPYYIVFALSKKQFNRTEVLKNVLASRKKVHISVISVFSELRMLPKECAKVIELDELSGRLYDKNDVTGSVLPFRPDIQLNMPALELSRQLANIQLDDSDQSTKLPKMITFLQMLNVGKVEHLNAAIRWKENDPTKSLAVPVGVNPYGDLFVLDLHEKYHGPHGLVAGMTGSGKSEFIITYILSLAVNFHPEEVSFIMIDYKGGGMAKSFENLPHTAGIITNLDGSAIKRSLVSINSELKRRQALLSSASKMVGESNMNIYQYQKLYRQKLVSEPLSHLFIIADEFAELKTQQPDFMTELISAARIGRSLGVHLILATQKPSGVVDDQIWSNSRFRVCLKVQERQDSMDMLKRPDAAELSDTGRFYLQVGYNELFELGQSSWAGAEYIPSDRVIVEKDNGVEAIDLNGHILRAVKPRPPRMTLDKPKKQLDTITDYLCDIAKAEGTAARQLWLEPIPERIYISELMKKYPSAYAESTKRGRLEPVIGEYDDPANQKQGLLTLPITAEGNAIIYGAAGSGKSLLLNTIIYSLITGHTAEEVNLYMLDFADETLGAFSRAPQVGEVMLSNDSEKIARLFKSLYQQIKKRKKKLSMLGTDFGGYSAANSDMPAIVIVIHNYTAFAELYGDNEDDIIYLSREGLKYGIYFLLTTIAANGIRYRIAQNFKQHVVLQQNDDSDYSTLLGKTDGLFPAKLKGRGLVKRDKLLEFQSAHISRSSSEFSAIQEKCDKLRDEWSGVCAEKIPVLPDVVDTEFLLPAVNEKRPLELPVGVNKATLRIQKFDFSQRCVNLLTSAGGDHIAFLGEFLSLLCRVPGLDITVFDPEGRLYGGEAPAISDRVRFFGNVPQCSEGILWLFDEIVKRNNTYKEAIEAGKSAPEFPPAMCIFVSMKGLTDCLSDDRPERLSLVLEKNDPAFRFNMLVADNAKDLSGYSFNPWYKKQISGTDGIWCGNGVTEQYAIKPNSTTPAMRQAISAPLGYVIEKGEPALCKLISEGGENDGD